MLRAPSHFALISGFAQAARIATAIFSLLFVDRFLPRCHSDNFAAISGRFIGWFGFHFQKLERNAFCSEERVLPFMAQPILFFQSLVSFFPLWLIDTLATSSGINIGLNSPPGVML